LPPAKATLVDNRLTTTTVAIVLRKEVFIVNSRKERV
jgi:hypothetical protein